MEECCPDVGNFLKAIASETRQRIIFLFADGKSRTVGAIAEELDIVPSTASEHLTIMKRGGLVDAVRDGKEVYYQPNRDKTVELLKKCWKMLLPCFPELKDKD